MYIEKQTIIRISHGTTPLKKIPSVTQTSLLVGKGSMFGPLSRTPPQHPVHGPFDLQTRPIIIYFKDAKMFRCNYYTNIDMSSINKYIRLKYM
jgi:hypothetical protein